MEAAVAAAKAAAAALARKKAESGEKSDGSAPASADPAAVAAAKAAAAALAARAKQAANAAKQTSSASGCDVTANTSDAAKHNGVSNALSSDTVVAAAATMPHSEASQDVSMQKMQEAARAAAAALAKKICGQASEAARQGSHAVAAGPAGAGVTADPAKRSAAAAFAESLKKKPRWGDGSTSIVIGGDSSGAGASSAAKQRQALAVSQLQDKLSAFRRDRGVDDPVKKEKKTLKIPLPEPQEGQFERNWVGILIGREGINKKRLEALTGATIFVRGKGTQLRGQKPKASGGEEAEEEPMHVVLEAETEEQLDRARVEILNIIEPRDSSSALVLYDDEQMEKMAIAKTTNNEECAFCGKPGHHHSKCPKRRSKFSMSGVVCSACGSGGHTIRDCKGDRSNVVKLHPAGSAPRPSVLEDADYAAFLSELDRRKQTL